MQSACEGAHSTKKATNDAKHLVMLWPNIVDSSLAFVWLYARY
jgi:hypothetical protein